MDYDKTRLAENYARAREHGPAVTRQWMDVVSSGVDRESVDRVLDLGCGTGRFTGALASEFDAWVFGADPSETMLREARKDGVPNPRVFLLRASAEALPLHDASFDLIFISMVFHHFDSPRDAARECRRVLRAGGRVFLRTGTRDQVPEYAYVPFFPTSVPLLERRLPSVADQRRTFEEAGFEMVDSGVIVQETAGNFGAYHEKLSLGADSILASLDTDDFQAGLERLRAFAAAPQDGRPVREPIDYLVFATR